MLMLATAGLNPCETIDVSPTHKHGCRLCERAADGYDATFDGPLCRACAEALQRLLRNHCGGWLMDAGETPPLADFTARHRDLLWILSQSDPSESHTLKQTLESYSNKEITDHEFITALDDLTVGNLIVKRSHDDFTTKYHLIESARRAFQARQAWQSTSSDRGYI